MLLTDFTDRLYVMEGGEIIFAGMSRQARKDAAAARVIEGDRRGWLIETAGPPVIDV